MMGGVVEDPSDAVRPGDSASPVILHVPHSSRFIPPEVRAGLLLDDAELAAELSRMTDADTDLIAERAAGTALTKAWSFVNPLSRLVIDPERFPDDREDMRAVGMGAIYTRTSDGSRLRAADDADLMDRYYWPYARSLTRLVNERLDAVGTVTIIDVHSYPSRRLPYERGGADRPAICVGIDATHTPGSLATAAREAFAPCGDLAENTPFAGCYIPLDHYTVDSRVSGVMIEIRRDLYVAEPDARLERPSGMGLGPVADCLARLIDAVSPRSGRP
jgi:N-formylglutamate amidohydrolase